MVSGVTGTDLACVFQKSLGRAAGTDLGTLWITFQSLPTLFRTLQNPCLLYLVPGVAWDSGLD